MTVDNYNFEVFLFYGGGVLYGGVLYGGGGGGGGGVLCDRDVLFCVFLYDVLPYNKTEDNIIYMNNDIICIGYYAC